MRRVDLIALMLDKLPDRYLEYFGPQGIDSINAISDELLPQMLPDIPGPQKLRFTNQSNIESHPKKQNKCTNYSFK